MGSFHAEAAFSYGGWNHDHISIPCTEHGWPGPLPLCADAQAPGGCSFGCLNLSASGLGACDATLIQRRMRKRLPTILEHNGSRLWIDRYYIALEDDSSGFRYLYLTRWHAEETLRDHRGLLRMRQTSVLDSQTLAMYDAALNSMRVERRGYITYPLQA